MIILDEMPQAGYRWLYVYTDDLLRSSSIDNYQRALKIGDTERTVRQRVYVEQDGTDRIIHPDVIFTALIPQPFRDKDIHATLRSMGHEPARLDKDREFFIIKEETETDRIREIQRAIQITTQNPLESRMSLELTISQYRDLENAIDAYRQGKDVQVHEKAPRFGKTPWSLALFSCLDERVMVVAAYWLSAITSFNNDIVKFIEFANIRFVDAAIEGWADLMDQYLTQGFKVVVGVSLHAHGDRREFRKEDLLPLRNITDKFVFVDEADYGAWRKGQKDLVDWIIGC